MKLKPGMREKNGSIEYRFTVDGKRYSVSAKTVRDCLTKEKEIRIRGNTYTPVTVDQYFDLWISRRRIRESTVLRYKSHYKHIAPIIGNKPLSSVTRGDIVRIHNSGNNAALKLCKTIFGDAVNDELISKSPAVNVSSFPESTVHHRALTVEEQIRFIEAAKKEWLYEAFMLALLTGMRIGEVCALKWSDIGETIKVSKTITRAASGAFIVGTDAKTRASAREIPVTPQIIEVLEDQKRKSRSEYIFVSIRGNLVNANTAGLAFRRIIKSAGIDPCTTHSLRDTFATRWIENKGSIQVLKNILGHASIRMTMDLYAQVLPDAKRKEMESIEIIPTKSPQAAPN